MPCNQGMDTREEEALAAQQAACKAARTARGSGPGWQPWRSWSRRHEEVANAEVQDATCSDTQVAPPSQGSSQRSSCSSAGTEEGGGTTGRLTACAQQGEACASGYYWLRHESCRVVVETRVAVGADQYSDSHSSVILLHKDSFRFDLYQS